MICEPSVHEPLKQTRVHPGLDKYCLDRGGGYRQLSDFHSGHVIHPGPVFAGMLVFSTPKTKSLNILLLF